MTLDFPNTDMTFDLPALKELAAKTSGTVTFGMEKATGLTGDALATIGTRPVYQLTVSYQSGGKTMYITNFGKGSVSVALAYTPTAAEQYGSLYAVYVDDKGKVEWLNNSSYDRGAKTVRFSTNHFSVFGIGYKPAPTFTDVANHWAKDDIAFVVSRGILTGTGNTTFSPGDSMTRGMFVTALGRLADADVSGYKQSSFRDVSNTAYYMGYVEWASKNGIVNGLGGGKFAPDKSISREQMATILVNYAKAIGFTPAKVHEKNTFADSASISSYAKDAVKQMQMAGILSGKSGNKFDPQGTATRGEVSAMLRRFVELVISTETAEGWAMNDSGQWMYVENGKRIISATKTIDGTKYTFDQYGVTADMPKDRRYTNYTVQKGDSFWGIAWKYKVSVFELAQLNDKTIFSIIHPGDELKIPQK